MKRALGNTIFSILLLLSILLVVATPFLALGFDVIALGNEDICNQPQYVLLLIFLRPHLFLAFLWSTFVLANRRGWVALGTISSPARSVAQQPE